MTPSRRIEPLPSQPDTGQHRNRHIRATGKPTPIILWTNSVTITGRSTENLEKSPNIRAIQPRELSYLTRSFATRTPMLRVPDIIIQRKLRKRRLGVTFETRPLSLHLPPEKT